jgi:hypothetical protein
MSVEQDRLELGRTAHRAGQTRAELDRAVHEAEHRQSEQQPDAQPQKSLADLRKEAHAARSEVATTLDAIEYKLNLPKQIRINTRRLTYALRDLGDRNPGALIGIAVGAASVVAAAVWLGVKASQNR